MTYVLPLPDPLPVAHHATYTFETGDVIEGLEAAVGYVDERRTARLPGPPRQGVSIRFWQVDAPVASTPQAKAGPTVVRAINPALLPPPSDDRERRPWVAPSDEIIAMFLTGRGPDFESVDPADLDLSRPPVNYTTVAEMTTFVRRHPDLGLDPDGLDPFSRCQAQLELFVRAYRLADRHSLVSRISYQRLDPNVFYFWRDPTDVENGGFLGGIKLLLLGHVNTTGLGIASQPVDPAAHEHIAYFAGRLRVRDPFVLAAEYMHDGRRSYQADGNTTASALNYAMGSEILLDALLGHLLWEEDMERETSDLTPAVDELSTDLARRVRTAFHHRLGGSWSTDGPGPVAHWRHDIAQLRGRIVHRGYRPTVAESDECSAAAVALLEFVKARLAANILRYPRTTFVLLRGEGIRRRGLWPQIEAWWDAHRHEPDYGTSYASWRDEVDERLRSSGRF